MSDALSDIARDERRGRAFSECLYNLANYLEKPSKITYSALRKSAEETDSVHGGYWGGGNTNLNNELIPFLRNLHKNDITTWVNLMDKAKDCYSEKKRLKSLSPVKDFVIFPINYHINELGDFTNIVYNLILQNGEDISGSNKYFLLIPQNQLLATLGNSKIVKRK
jgi:hypothetical protein